jgi:hypothetical protein
VSAQTGRAVEAPAPPSSRRIDRARVEMRRLRDDPNPVWMRELRQAARLQRTPVILAVSAAGMTLLIASIGGMVSTTAEPAKVGFALYQVFFSLAFALVSWIAPAVAANTIASERGGHTWEALVLTGLGAKSIARGKFFAALTYVLLYLVMLAPVGALPFLFGGVTASQVLVAFALLFLFAVLAVAFGLSISSTFSSPAMAIAITLMVAVPLSIVAYVGLGVGLSFPAHDLWPAVADGPPVWLPTALTRAGVGLGSLTYLVLTPLALTAVPAWFFYEVTVAKMSDASDDRSTGLRRWFVVSAIGLGLVSLAPPLVAGTHSWKASVAGIGFMNLMYAFVAFVFAGDPLGPSRRVRVHWERAGAGRVRRFFGPGVLKAVVLLLVMGLSVTAVQTAEGVALAGWHGAKGFADVERVVVFAAYAAAFLVFIGGFTAWTRARATTGTAPRFLLFVALFIATVGPWIVMGVGSAMADSERALLLAGPSPLFAFNMIDALDTTGPLRDLTLAVGACSAGAWALIGVGLLSAARARVGRTLKARQAAEARFEADLAAEQASAS